MPGIEVSPGQVYAAARQLREVLSDTSRPAAPTDRSADCLPIEGKCCVRYYPALREPAARPLLLVHALVSRPQVLDLGPGDSFIKRMQGQGHPVYLMDWGSPDAVDAGVSLADYVCGYLRTAVRLVRQRHAARSIDLLGVCQGGGLALCLASIEPRRIHRLVTLATAVDFHTPSDVLRRLMEAVDLPSALSPDGNVSGDLVAGMFERIRCLRRAPAERSPVQTLLDGPAGERQRLLNMLAWQSDYPDQAGRAWEEWVTASYRENRLVAGTLVLDGERVDMRRLTMPIMNVYARDDHLVPVAAVQALGRLVGARQYAEMELPCGHLGVFAGRRSLATLPAAVSTFLSGRGRSKGS